MNIVPNQFPTNETHLKLAIVGEAPGQEEDFLKRPFVGPSGRLLRHLLGTVNLTADHCFLGNVCQVKPPGNDISKFQWEGPEIQDGLGQLRHDLSKYQPNCTLVLGRTAFRGLGPSFGSDADTKWDITSYRGSILVDNTSNVLPVNYNKFIPSYHPAYILRSYGEKPFLKFDLARAKMEAAYPELRRLHRAISIRPSFEEVCTLLESLLDTKVPAGFDVEGWTDNVGITMLSIAVSPTVCTVIPFFIEGRHYWQEHEEVEVWRRLARWLSDPRCPKIVTNAFYELFILAWRHGIVIEGIVDDTMIKTWEIQPEFPKSLACQVSLYTKEPFYKDERTHESVDVNLTYNGKDSCCTKECNTAQEVQLARLPQSHAHYRFNINLIPALGYIQLRGCRFDQARARDHIQNTRRDLDPLQATIDEQLVGPGVEAGVLTRKRKSDPWSFNVKSVDQKRWLLYNYFGYKEYSKHGDSTKEEVLLRYYAKHRDPLLKTVIEAIGKRTRISDIEKLVFDDDGRLRAGYNLVGTDTGRLSSQASNARVAFAGPKGRVDWVQSGTNLQNVTRELRDCFISDSPDHAFFQCDLTGADAWTVAADLAALGHSTMLDDLLAGIRPAKVLILMLQEVEAGRPAETINNLDRPTLKALTKALKFPDEKDSLGRQGDWKYLCAKRCQHGSNYGMEPDKLSATIFKDSEGTIDLTTKDAELYQRLYKIRYNPAARYNYIRSQLSRLGYLDSAAGTRRIFHSLRYPGDPDPEVVRQALSFEPQINTTYVCNKALGNLWYDNTNRTSRDSLFIEPLILIHDAIAGQFIRKHSDFAVASLKRWFHNPIKIHGIEVSIPFEGGYGTDWKNCKEVEF